MDELEEQSWYRKPLLVISCLFLVFIIISLSFIDTIQGIVQSKTVRDGKLVFPNSTIVFANNTLQLIQQEYLSNPEREIKACLFGSINASVYYIERVEFPRIVRANVVHIVSVQCPSNTIIDLHSHPINSCLASEQDVAVFKGLKSENPALKMLIMCSRNRFALVN